MKTTKNTLYFTEDFLQGKLIDNYKLIKQDNVNQIKLTDKESEELYNILVNNTSELRHRCISVYRDAIKIGNDVFNICLSCGDYYKNDERFYLNQIGIDKIKELKERVMNKPTDLEYRMYGLVPYNISPIQQGIQYGHAVVEYIDKYLNVNSDLNALLKWMKKYYTPNIEELGFGFECELKNNADAQQRFDKYKLDSVFLPIAIKVKSSGIRVKYLDKSDLIELGFEITHEETKPYGYYLEGFLKYKKQKLELWYSFLTKNDKIYISLKDSHYNGNTKLYIKNKSELEKILIQLEVK